MLRKMELLFGKKSFFLDFFEIFTEYIENFTDDFYAKKMVGYGIRF